MRSFRRALSSAAQRVTLTRGSDGVAQVTLNRGSKMNALDMPMFRAIAATARELIADRGVRAVVVHGDGRAFCSGLDVRGVMSPLSSAKANSEELLRRPDGELSNLAQDVGYLWRRVPAPVIAATHGVCFGGGFQIALGADMRVSAPACKFSIMEAKWGIVPDMGATTTLPELVPKDVALELTMTGRIFDGAEALKLGLVTRLADDPLAEALKLAREIAARSPDSTAATKRLLHATYADPDDGRCLHLETEVQRKLIGGWNQAASSAKGLGLPALLMPGFRQRAETWDEEADERAEAELRKMLDGAEGLNE
jgi:enoyl-CoA hydratase/carnithine racemase